MAGCIGVERVDDELVIRSLAVDPRLRRRGIGRALVEALVGAATETSALVAETDDEASGFYARCGFEVEAAPARGAAGRFRCSRAIKPNPVGDAAVAAITLREIEAAVRAAWSPDTSEDPHAWSEENPAAGQCGVTALVVRELLGGEILIASVVRDGRRTERHAWNRLPSGIAVDLTREQFSAGELLEEPAVGEPMVAAHNRERFELFAQRVRDSLFGETRKPS